MVIFGISRPTMFRWLAADNIETHSNGRKEKHVKWGDILDASWPHEEASPQPPTPMPPLYEVADMLVPLDTVIAHFGRSRRTIELWLAADGIETHSYKGVAALGIKHGRSVKWGDIQAASVHPTRWKRVSTGKL